MNSASQWRFVLAQQISPLYAANPYVAAILVAGSTARGHADRYSDIEIGVFWHQPPSDANRQMIANRVRGDLIRLYPYNPAEELWCDAYTLGRAHPDLPNSGILVEVVQYTTEVLNRTFDTVLDHHVPIPVQHNHVRDQWFWKYLAATTATSTISESGTCASL